MPASALHIVPLARVDRPPMADSAKMNLTSINLALQVMEPYLTPAIREQVEAEFGAYLGKGQYPTVVGIQLVDFLCQACLPEHALTEARRLFGQRSVAKYRESILGRVMLAALPLMGLERILRQAPRQLSAVNNYGTRWVTELGPQHWRLDCDDEIMPPETLQGSIEVVGQLLHASGLQVTYSLPAPKHIAFEITWSPR
ncbi:MAG TPA: DUF2378 family protein [Chloroflexia bacterium]|nr:DUF2378 family protein [Chloroflexia bacterium]